jgi:hypothetical protein
MRKNCFILLMFLIFPNLSLHSAMRIIKYSIINDADENIFLTAFPNNTLRERRFILYSMTRSVKIFEKRPQKP